MTTVGAGEVSPRRRTDALAYGCIILGAGSGARFGEPKAGAELRPGTRFVDEVVRLAAAAGAKPVIAVVPPGLAVPAPARVVINTGGIRGGEQMGSIRLGLAALVNTNTRGTLLWPVDHPFVTVDTARALSETHRRTGMPVVVPVHTGRRGHPIFVAREMWGELMGVEDGVGGARLVVRACDERGKVEEVHVCDPGVLRDIDTRADLRVGGEKAGNAVP